MGRCFRVQVKYVVELARALAQHPVVYRVDLLTRLIQDPQVDPEYGQAEECLYRSEDSGSLGGAYIVRLPCGKPDVYIRCLHLLLGNDQRGSPESRPVLCTRGSCSGRSMLRRP